MAEDDFDKLLDGIQEPPREPTTRAPRGPGRPADPGSLTAQLGRGDAKQLKAIVPADLYRRLKVLAAMTDRQISEIVADAVRDWLEKHST